MSGKTRKALWAGGVLALTSVFLGGCLKSTDVRPSDLQLTGEWAYTGVQTGPVRENLVGELLILDESGTSFHGQLNLVVTNEATGEMRALDGAVSGSGDGNVIDFDAQAGTTTRRHVGRIVGNTITGTWVSSSSSGTMSSGTFRAERGAQ